MKDPFINTVITKLKLKQLVKDPFTDPSKNQIQAVDERPIHILVFSEKPIHKPITDLGISICSGSVNCERLKKDEER